MVAVPAVPPVIKPTEVLTDAMAELLLLHVPPEVTSLSIVVKPEQTLVMPVIARGSGFTVMFFIEMQPVGKVYVMVTGPAATPVSTPVLLIVASEVLLLLQVPPAVASVNCVVAATHTPAAPEIAAGKGFTITDVVAMQPKLREYVMVVVPRLSPSTVPVLTLTAAIAELLLLHVPPPALLSVVVPLKHTLVFPEIGPGTGLTTTDVVAIQPVGKT